MTLGNIGVAFVFYTCWWVVWNGSTCSEHSSSQQSQQMGCGDPLRSVSNVLCLRCDNSDLCLPLAEKELVCPCKAKIDPTGRNSNFFCCKGQGLHSSSFVFGWSWVIRVFHGFPIPSYSHGGNGMMVACAGIWDDLQCGGLRQEWRGDRILHSMRQGGHCLSVWKEHHQLPWSKWRALSGGFQSMGVSLNHPFIDGISIINHPFWGTICGSPPPKKLWITLRRV